MKTQDVGETFLNGITKKPMRLLRLALNDAQMLQPLRFNESQIEYVIVLDLLAHCGSIIFIKRLKCYQKISRK